MKPIAIALLVSFASIVAFAGGTLFGYKQGVTSRYLSTAAYDAEVARRNLTWLDSGDVKKLRGMLTLDLQSALGRQYGLLHYPFTIFIPAYIHKSERVFMGRILDYAQQHPEDVKDTQFTKLIEQYAPARTPEQRELKDWQLSNAHDFDDRIAWVLDYYRNKPGQ